MQASFFSGNGRVIPLLISLFIMAGCSNSGSSGGNNSGGESAGNGGSNEQAQSDSTLDIEAICALPTLGPAVVSAASGDCSQSDGGAGFDASSLCAVPVLGPAMVSGSGGECEGASDGGSPFDSLPVDQLKPLCDIPTLGPAILGSVGGECKGVDALPIPNITTLTPGLICSIPELGEPLARAIGENCDDNLSAIANPGYLCLVPVVGEVLAQAAGYDCIVPGVIGDPDILACQLAPLEPVLQAVCPLPDPEALCAIPVLGAELVEPFLGSCPDSDDSFFLPAVGL